MGRAATGGTTLIVLIFVLGSFALAMGQRAAPTKGPVQSSIEMGASGDARPGPSSAPPAEHLGVVLARSAADLAPRAGGKLLSVQVRAGDHVTRGQALATIDVSSLPFDLRVAEAHVAEAEAQRLHAAADLTQAEERLRRREALAASALTSAEELASARTQHAIAASQLDVARAQLAERRAEVERLRRDRADTVLRAPFDGIVAARYLDPGATLSSLTPIVRLLSVGDAFVRFAVPEQRASTLSPGRQVHLRVEGDSRSRRGTIDAIAPEIDGAARLVFVEARLDPTDEGPAPLSGMIVRVSIDAEEVRP